MTAKTQAENAKAEKVPAEIRTPSAGSYVSAKPGISKRKPKEFHYRQLDETVVAHHGRKVGEGHAERLGATLHPDGINFAVHAPHARDVFLVLFDSPEGPAGDVIRLPGRTGYVRHGFVEGLRAGQLYGFRARGEFNPTLGLRFNENKLLIDPYARAFAGRFSNQDNLLLPYDALSPEKDGSLDDRDSASAVPKSIAYGKPFDWEGDELLRIPFAELVVYEVHLKGFTAHASSGVPQPGSYLGFIEKIPYLKSLGVNAVELMPIHAKFPADRDEANTPDHRRLDNYWGYNTYGFFAPEPTYASGKEPGCEVEEFKALVKALHKAGIEVILDVVYNHTAEGNEMGPLFAFKGLDNAGYYALAGSEDEPARHYHNHTGTGNTMDFGSPAVVRMTVDSLRYWVEEMHVDGFRFDLALVHGRGFWQGFEARAPFFQVVAQDPVLRGVKLIAEPWDCNGYEQGAFPVGWAEWNGKFRDCMRRFVKGDAGQLGEVGRRLTGSTDLLAHNGRGSEMSVNFVAAHDGFTLADLVSYDAKHNEANGEENRDGFNDNLSWNCGAEGETEDQAVLDLRRRQARNFICLLLFAQGTPMLSHGDEMLRSQRGNNNAYCQDNELAWMDWTLAEKNRGVLDFVRNAIALRKRIPALLGKRPVQAGGAGEGKSAVPDFAWFNPDGKEPPWDDPEARSIGYQLNGIREAEGAERRYCFLLNMSPEEVEFALPAPPQGMAWARVADTSLPDGADFLQQGKTEPLLHPGLYRSKERSVVILQA